MRARGSAKKTTAARAQGQRWRAAVAPRCASDARPQWRAAPSGQVRQERGPDAMGPDPRSHRGERLQHRSAPAMRQRRKTQRRAAPRPVAKSDCSTKQRERRRAAVPSTSRARARRQGPRPTQSEAAAPVFIIEGREGAATSSSMRKQRRASGQGYASEGFKAGRRR